MNFSDTLRKVARQVSSGEMFFSKAENVKDVKVLRYNRLHDMQGSSVPVGGYLVSVKPNSDGSMILSLANMDNPQMKYDVHESDLYYACQNNYAQVNDFSITEHNSKV